MIRCGRRHDGNRFGIYIGSRVGGLWRIGFGDGTLGSAGHMELHQAEKEISVGKGRTILGETLSV